MTTMNEQVLTRDEAAAFLKVGKQRLLRLARRGDKNEKVVIIFGTIDAANSATYWRFI
jgi:hypothetical protein